MIHRRSFIALAAAGSAFGLSACASLPRGTPLTGADRDALRIASVEVVTSGASFENAGAEEYRNQLAGNLRAQIEDEFADRRAATGWTLVAEIAALNVASATSTALGRDRSRLAGQVRLVDQQGAIRASFPVEVVAGTAAETVVGGAAKAAIGSRAGFYRTLLTSFALESRGLILGRDLPGERLLRRARTG